MTDSRSGRRSFDSKLNLPSPARRGSRSRPPLRRPRPLRLERLRVPVWNPYSRGRLSPAKSEDRKGGEGKADANLTIFFSTCCAPLGAPRRFRNPKIGQQLGEQQDRKSTRLTSSHR